MKLRQPNVGVNVLEIKLFRQDRGVRVILLCHAETVATGPAAFPSDDPLSNRGWAQAQEYSPPRAELVVHAPSIQCAQTAEALGVPALRESAIAGCDHGAWRGRTLEDVLATEHEALARWLTDPNAAPHGGEPVANLVKRAGTWLDGLSGDSAVLAITEQSFIRAALVHAIEAKPSSYWRLDIAPLELVVLSGQAGRWHLRAGS